MLQKEEVAFLGRQMADLQMQVAATEKDLKEMKWLAIK
jgi:hypothetical protein